MSRFFSEKFSGLSPYTPGEQPQDMQYVKLNTNENPFPPAPEVIAAASEAASTLRQYPDPDCRELTAALAELYGVDKSELVLSNGSDETLNFAFMAFCDENNPAVFADITYGFYPVFAQLNNVPYREVPLKEDFTLDLPEFCRNDATVFIANPNAPTGIALTPDEIETVLKANPDRVVVVDEAYVDFGAESCVPLIHTYPNLLVIQTTSKSRSMAGARLGWAIADAALIADLNAIRFSTNPYNINRMTMAAGLAAVMTDKYSKACCEVIAKTREYTCGALRDLGFEVIPSKANFIFAAHPQIPGEVIYTELKKRGVLVRHFTKERIARFNRISVGSREDMDVLLKKLGEILEERS